MRLFQRLQTRLNVIFLLLAVVPLVVVSVIISQRAYNVLWRDAYNDLQLESNRAVAEVNAFIDGRAANLRYMAYVNGLQGNVQTASIAGLLAFDNAFQEVTLLDRAGLEIERVSRTNVIPQSSYGDRSNQPEYLAVVAGAPIYYSPVRFDDDLREPLMTIAVPVIDRRTGEIYRVLVADFRVRAIWQLLGTRDTLPGENTYLLSVTGEVVAHQNPSVVLRGTSVALPSTPTGSHTGLNGEAALYASERLRFGDLEFIVVAEQTVNQALALGREVREITLVVLAGALLVVGALSLFVVRSVVNPIQYLSETAQQIAAGDLSRRVDVAGGDEFAHLATSFNAMTDQLRASITKLETRLSELRIAEEALRVKHSQLDSFFNLSLDLLAIADTDGNFIKVNQAWEKILGEPKAVLDDAKFLDYVHPDDLPATLAVMAKLGQGETVKNFVNRYRTQSGEYRLIEWASQPSGNLIFAVARDVTERERREAVARENDRLRLGFKQAQEHNSFIQRVISSLSHDMRIPLAVILSARDILDRYSDRLTPDKRQERLDTIARQVNYMVSLIEDTVHIIRSDDGQHDFHPTPIKLPLLCAVSVQELRATEAANHKLVFDDKSQLDTVVVDEVLISRMLLNLLTNAVKYSPPGSEIRLELTQRDTWIVIRVIDRGIGISTEDQTNVFEPFYRADDVKNTQGSGLGLSIVKACVERHAGQVYLESEVGVGTTVTVELPLRVPTPA